MSDDIRKMIDKVRNINSTITENIGADSFQIPKELEPFYQISGNFSNISNWKAKILIGNSLSNSKRVGDWDSVGYVLISITTNFIIPVARSDEHQAGYDLLYDLVLKYKIKDLKYRTVFLLGTHYVYASENHNEQLQAIRKAYAYGAHDISIKEMGGKYNGMNIVDYIATNGDFSEAIKTGRQTKKISSEGQKFINELANIVNLFEQYRLNPMRQNAKFEDNIITSSGRLKRIIASNDIIYDTLRWGKNKESAKNTMAFEAAIETRNIQEIERALFSFNGIKNVIHILLKKNDKSLEQLFWSNEAALEQFNAMSNIQPLINKR